MFVALIPVLLTGVVGDACPVDGASSSSAPETSISTPGPATTEELLSLSEGRHRDLFADSILADLGESVEIVPGVTWKVEVASMSDQTAYDDGPLVAATVSYENRSDEDAMVTFGVVCEGTTDPNSGQYVEGPDDLSFEGVLPPGTTDGGEILIRLPSYWNEADRCDGPAWVFIGDAWGMTPHARWPICGDVIG